VTKDEARGYLAGMIDGEGTVQAVPKKRRIKITNTNPELIEAVLKCCEVLGIKAKSYPRGFTRIGTPLFEVLVDGLKPLARVRDVVPVQGSDKARKIQEAATPCARGKKLTEDDVAEIRRRLTSRYCTDMDLARDFGVSHGMIAHIRKGREWL
jgi:hypothetical protein